MPLSNKCRITALLAALELQFAVSLDELFDERDELSEVQEAIEAHTNVEIIRVEK